MIMYACRIATIISMIDRIIIRGYVMNINFIDDINIDDRRRIIVCPAIILAVNRIFKVIGRIQKLIISIINMNGIRIVGVLIGMRWIKKFFFFLKRIRIGMGIHINIIIERLNGMHDVKFHEYGSSLIKFMVKIMKNVLDSDVLDIFFEFGMEFVDDSWRRDLRGILIVVLFKDFMG